MNNIKTILQEAIAKKCDAAMAFNILYVTDEASRLNYVRGVSALDEVKRFYGNIAKCNVCKISSAQFIDKCVNFDKFDIIWVDNVIDHMFNRALLDTLDAKLNEVLPDWKENMPEGEEEQLEYVKDINEYRALYIRAIYALDEFVWDAPGGRQKTVISAKTVEDAMAISDEVIVPTIELRDAIRDIGLVTANKDVLVIPTFMNENFYPVNRIVTKSSKFAMSIRKPKVLVKGVYIPSNVQNLIIHNADKYDFTISSIVELDPRLMKLLETRNVKNIQHWANPYVNSRNLLTTMAIERDMEYDFVILTYGDAENRPEQNAYAITDTDTDALIAVATGAIAIAGVDGMEFGEGTHISQDTGLTFGIDTKIDDLLGMLKKWSVCSNWDNAYGKQYSILKTRLVSSPMVMAGYFNAFLGRAVSEARQAKYAPTDAGKDAE